MCPSAGCSATGRRRSSMAQHCCVRRPRFYRPLSTVITSRSRRRAPRAQRRLLAQRATYACHAAYRPAAAFLPPPILSIPLCAGARRRCACLVRCARPSVRTRHGPSPPTVSPSATALTGRSLPVRVPPAPSLTVQLRLLVSTGLTRTGCVRCHRPRPTVTVALPLPLARAGRAGSPGFQVLSRGARRAAGGRHGRLLFRLGAAPGRRRGPSARRRAAARASSCQ